MNHNQNAQYWIDTLGLEAHPEGGYFKEIYRSLEIIDETGLPSRFQGERHLATSIYFLLQKEQVSHLHRIRSDEMWHHYAGLPLEVHMISTKGKASRLLLGKNIEQGENFFGVVPAGCWFGASVKPPQEVGPEHEGYDFSLVGCTVSPGFDFHDFELANQSDLLQEYPDHKDLIERLTASPA